MLKSIALCLAATFVASLALTAAAEAGGRRSERVARPPSRAGATYNGPVNNYYGPVTIYEGRAEPAYPQASYPAASGYAQSYGEAYGGGYGSWSAYDSYGPFAGGVGYSPYGDYGGGYGYGAPVYGARMDPWNGYNGGAGNGYW